MTSAPLIYHITEAAAWEAAQQAGHYRGDTLGTEGFIHFSTEQQVARTANRFYQGRQGLVVLEVAPDRTDAPLKFENLEGGSELFPHLYGPLPVTAVVRAIPFPPDAHGGFSFPSPA